ncbi:MAG TPA: peroxiredoxin [Caulobacteraceae bacterium]
MRRLLTGAAMTGLMLSCLAAAPAFAALKTGDKAPEFTAQASMGGKVFTFSMKDALKKGPVVLYFYPAAFTPGCTLEAHEFADAMDDFKKLHATVIGVSRDDIDKLNKFSVSECRSKFPVAADTDGKITQSYDVVLIPPWNPKGPTIANRTSYVISKGGKVAYEYTSLDPAKHVENTMGAVKSLDAR